MFFYSLILGGLIILSGFLFILFAKIINKPNQSKRKKIMKIILTFGSVLPALVMGIMDLEIIIFYLCHKNWTNIIDRILPLVFIIILLIVSQYIFNGISTRLIQKITHKSTDNKH